MPVVVTLPVKYGPKTPPKVFRRKKYTEQAPASVQTLPVDPLGRAYRLYLAASAIDETDIPSAMALYEQALELDPELGIAQTNLGNCHYRQGREDLARRCYERALEVRPGQPEALYNLGCLALFSGNADRAIALLEASLEQDETFADAWFNLGMAYEKRLGTIRSPRVRRCFERFLRCVPTDNQWVSVAREHIA